MLVEVARQWEAQGDAAAALHFHQNAVKAWRDVPAAVRERLAGSEALERARHKVLSAGQAALGQVQPVKGPAIEVGDFIAYAQQRVQCLRPINSLFGLITLAAPPGATGGPEFAQICCYSIGGTDSVVSNLCRPLAGRRGA